MQVLPLGCTGWLCSLDILEIGPVYTDCGIHWLISYGCMRWAIRLARSLMLGLILFLIIQKSLRFAIDRWPIDCIIAISDPVYLPFFERKTVKNFQIELKNGDVGSIDDRGDGYLSADYDLVITIGETEYVLLCWTHCGWIAPGASQGLDGSGLALWGDSQPGGWESVSSDGSSQGSGQVSDDGEYSDPIRVETSMHHVEIGPECVPEWADAIAVAENAVGDEVIDAATEVCEAIRSEITGALSDALELHSPASADEPNADAIRNDLEQLEIEDVDTDLWFGATLGHQWLILGDECLRNPDDDERERLVGEMLSDAHDDLMAEIVDQVAL